MTPDPYKALREQARAIERHDDERAPMVAKRNQIIRDLQSEGLPIKRIAEAAKLSRETIYQITKREQ